MKGRAILAWAVLMVALPAFSACKKSAAPIEQKKAEVWTCPMHPQIRKPGPGKCPICGMDLVKVADEGSMDSSTEGHAAVHLTPERQQMIGMKIGVVEKKPLFRTVRAAGRLAFDPELYTAQTEYTEAVRQMERVKDSPIEDVRHSAQRMVQSAKLRLKILGLSDSQISNLRSQDSDESNLLLHKAGQDIWVYAEVHEMDLPSIQPGQSAEISASFLEGNKVAGKVVSVDRVINPATRTAKVRINVPKAKAQLRPESFVDVQILAPLGEKVVVPFDAVLDTGRETLVFITDGQGHFEPRRVTVQLQTGDEVAIGSGLQGGEKIVTSANFLLDSESRLKWVTH